MQKILIIEDDSVIRDELALLLSNEGYQTAVVTEFTNVAMQVSAHDPNLILLDLNLPERDGLSLCAGSQSQFHPHYLCHQPGLHRG